MTLSNVKHHETLDEIRAHIRRVDLSDFAGDLETARIAWRHHRELVEAPTLPADYRAAFESVFGYDPDGDSCKLNDEPIQPGYDADVERQAQEIWAKRQRENAEKEERPAQGKPQEIPGWVTSTPRETSYQLIMWGHDDDAEELSIDRAEYIALKGTLAGLRGYTFPRDQHD